MFRSLIIGFMLPGLAASVVAEVMIPGLVSSELEPELKGAVLIEELNCAACHAGDAALAGRSKKAPRLAEAASRMNSDHMEDFIRDPHGTKAGTTMPDVLAQLPADGKAQAAKALTHFLFSLKPNDFALQPPDAVAAREGGRLFHSRGCAACHSPRDATGKELMPATSVPLGPLEKKYSIKSLTEFLRQPHASRPSGRMPDMRLPGQEVDRIAHFLLQLTRVPGHLAYTTYRGKVFQGLESDEVEPERAGQAKDFALTSIEKVHHHMAVQYDGWLNIARAGSYSFYLEMNGGSLLLDGKTIIEQKPSDRRGVKQLEGNAALVAGWRRIQLTYFHTGRDPKFAFEMEGPDFPRQSVPSSMLSVSSEPVPALEPFRVDAALAASGREQFGKLGCAKCHDDLQVPSFTATAFAKLDPAKGCLSEAAGPWPHFDLNAAQRGLIAKALPKVEARQLDDKQQISKTLVTFNCIACHERAGLGGIPPERNAFFTGTRPSLGDQGRLPPPLTTVGAKLTPAWLAAVLLHGQRQRDYLDASMPQFGESNVGHMVKLFGTVDSLEPVTLPKVANIQESKTAGYEMMGTGGFSCIACHDFNGQKSAGAGALDIVQVTERIQKNWFHLYMRQPSRFHPTGIMPSYWPGGQSLRPEILGGDTAQQIEALWAYLEDGTRAKKPLGLSRQSNELRVTDMTEICRGRSPAGYRGIGVGYPLRISLAFDSEEMALRRMWKGEFATIEPGSFHPRGTDPISFPPGIPFHRLKSLDDSWPYKGKTNYQFPQDHGYQFRGYHLDAQRRPTLLYQYGGIAMQDFFEDVPAKDGKAFFKRTMRFEAASDEQPFYFRAACGKKITRASERVFNLDQLELRITCDQKGIIREGDPGEVLIPLTLPKGRSILSLEYHW